ncbi:TetR/AcrR family transcriptional regulator [Mucilaginibacter rubeus]|uniref:TetR/AcrR family transcriptional regulator n=1 Tax=Mucilaginibacter rubeus TaxID=2027860 RepID=A0AAE6MIA4_9SPHI|nr:MULTISPECIES: TetR/AcrR family transcriptional regulator [Mucilaginibacter]QEM04431.1 TetR/AcrR family transcriptional regulator [Mucilaginibacter rubeus]QEM17027.1 TetR/AcrR family transcriptional regulator [Mucilaginibacter gossypii]QTE46476.1 TetR/AcrR family transcriptional regulator [Mucilaginibacter rubeus]QTE53073.1 TetR/AcrR family transcriptional regulator [Mucilaginibacter rubeus]QTE58160.1 TetR/AcrR family transcriptional regulator [Mucilaginibacter rubeus]
MASKERIQRLKEETRVNILDAALHIVKHEGWQALSMRKIADVIEYTAPIIYEYFANKDAILMELTRKGYLILAKDMEVAKENYLRPEEQLEAMWLAYWSFAFDNKELYQVMFGVQMNCCCEVVKAMPEAQRFTTMISEAIMQVMNIKDINDEMICTKYYTFWSVVHGLVSINLLSRGFSDEVNRQVLKDTIGGIIRSMKDQVFS